MRKGLSLIELIFTIVIIAIVFTVIPKIILSLNKADNFVIRQDAIFNGISMMKMISNMPWDENNTDSSDVLHVHNGNFDCNVTSFRRVGAFIGARTCENNLTSTLILDNSGPITHEENDIGDFNERVVEINTTNGKLYDLNITVSYIEDNNISNLNQSNDVKNRTNLKRVRIKVFYTGKRGEQKQLTQFNYTSANIGQMKINKRVWK